MTQACSALVLAILLASSPRIWAHGQHVCRERVPNPTGDMYEQEWIEREVCCKGYEGSPWNCQPRCTPRCVHAQCTAPQECTCNEGYETVGGKEYSTVGCQPKCHACRHGDCIAPGRCRCWPAYVGQPLTGCQPVPKLLLPAEQCLRTACHCWQQYFSWTPLLQVAPRCISICGNGMPQPCLNIGRCVCNSINHFLICEGQEEHQTPQQYACEVIRNKEKTVEAVAWRTDHADRKDKVYGIGHADGKDHGDRRNQADRKDQKNQTVKDQDDRAVTKHLTDLDSVSKIRHKDSTDQGASKNQTDPKDREDRKDQADQKDQAGGSGALGLVFKIRQGNLTEESKDRTVLKDRNNQTDRKDRKDQADRKDLADERNHVNHHTNQVNHKDNPNLKVQTNRKDQAGGSVKKDQEVAKSQTDELGLEYKIRQGNSTTSGVGKILTNMKDQKEQAVPKDRKNQTGLIDREDKRDNFNRKKELHRKNPKDITDRPYYSSPAFLPGNTQNAEREDVSNSADRNAHIDQSDQTTPSHQSANQSHQRSNSDVKDKSLMSRSMIWPIVLGCIIVTFIIIVGVVALCFNSRSPFHTTVREM